MRVMERIVQKVRPGQWAALEEAGKKLTAAERRLGWPAVVKRYRPIFFGGGDLNTLIIEREWDSLAAYESALDNVIYDAEFQAIINEFRNVIEGTTVELYVPLP